MHHILSSKQRRSHVYNQIVLAMVCFDSITALVFIVSSAASPIKTEAGDPSRIFGAHGNASSCKAIGFLAQLGLTSTFYNVALCIYYKLVIVHSWRNARLEAVRVWLLVVPLALGFSLAFAGIPFYVTQIFGCYVPNYPIKDKWPVVGPFAILPICGSILAITGLTVSICWHVIINARRSRKWRFSSHEPETDPDQISGTFGQQSASLPGSSSVDVQALLIITCGTMVREASVRLNKRCFSPPFYIHLHFGSRGPSLSFRSRPVG